MLSLQFRPLVTSDNGDGELREDVGNDQDIFAAIRRRLKDRKVNTHDFQWSCRSYPTQGCPRLDVWHLRNCTPLTLGYPSLDIIMQANPVARFPYQSFRALDSLMTGFVMLTTQCPFPQRGRQQKLVSLDTCRFRDPPV